jgi:GTP diphosphokinase / guanosine-3',5'-bis(diphosphate) 3'-diphosphatase
MNTNKQRMLATAILIATQAHAGQFDRGGHPYILHPLAVMYNMRQQGFDIETQCVAVLHDVLEDNADWTTERLAEEGVSKEVIDALILMCHADGVDYFDYIEGMKHSIMALRVKKGDIEHNFDIRRLKGLRQQDFMRLEKYSKAYVLVQKLIENYVTIESFKRENL